MSGWRVERLDHEAVPLLVAVDAADRLTAVALGADRTVLRAMADKAGARLVERSDETASRAATELRQYLAGARTRFTVPLCPYGTPFEQKAWEALLAIPFGETRSYGEQAHWLGRPGAARAVVSNPPSAHWRARARGRSVVVP